MIIDAHTHIFPPEIRADRAAFAGPDEPAFSSLYLDPQARLAGIEDLLAMMDAEGIDRAVTFGFPWSRAETARRHNDYILEAQTRYPDRIIGLACLDPRAPWAETEARRCLAAGLQGLGELAVYTADFDRPTIAAFAGLGRLCQERNLPLLIHVNEPIGHQYPGKAPLTLISIHHLVRALAGIKLILAHWGGGLPFYGLLKKELPTDLSSVYFDTAASPYLYRPEIYSLVSRMVGPEKILFGSDFPLLRPGRYFREMAAAGLDPEAMRLVQGAAAAALW